MTNKHLTAAQKARLEARDEHGRFTPMFTPGQPTGMQVVDGIEKRIDTIGNPNAHAPALLVHAAARADTTDNRGEWWDRAFLAGEYGRPGKKVPRLPDEGIRADGTQTRGRGLTGHRRVHRMRYAGANGTSLRMPSKTQIRRFMDTSGMDTVDVPYGITDAYGNSRQGWVRVTRHPGGSYTVQTLGETATENDLIIGESIGAVLENRDPVALSLEELGQVRRGRAEAIGARLADKENVESSFIKSVDWDEATGSMYVTMKTGASYRYKATPRSAWEEIVNSKDGPGRAYNRFLKARKREGAGPAQKGGRCPDCGRFRPNDGDHVCTAGARSFVASDWAGELQRKYVAQRPRIGRTLDSDNVLRDAKTGQVLRDEEGHVRHKDVSDMPKGNRGRDANPFDPNQGWSAEKPKRPTGVKSSDYHMLDRGKDPYAGWTMQAHVRGVGAWRTSDEGPGWEGFDAPARVFAASVPPHVAEADPRAAFARALASRRGVNATVTGRLRSPGHEDGEGVDVAGGRVWDPTIANDLAAAERQFAAGGRDRRAGAARDLRSLLGDVQGLVGNVRTDPGQPGWLIFDF